MASSNPTMPTHVQETITLNNQEDPSLLNLPAEIRNRIYEYVFGGLQLCPMPCHATTPGRYVVRMKYKTEGCEAPWRRWRNRVNFLRTCRQVHTEAALLIFELNDFHLINFATFHYFKTDLTYDQRRAIASVRFEYNDNNMRRMTSQMSKIWRNFTTPQAVVAVVNFDAGVLFPLELPGLTRVVAELPKDHRMSWYLALREKVIKAIMKQWGGSDGLEIMFKTF